MSVAEYFPFGVWFSNDPRQRWQLDFNENGVVWRERNTAGQALSRTVPLIKGSSSFRIERPNNAEVLAFLGARAGAIAELMQRSPAPSFMELVLAEGPERIVAHWNGLLWKLDPAGHVTSMDQPGSTPQTRADFTCPRQGNDGAFYQVSRGQLTFDAEGQERGPNHSRFLHWPGGASGVTLGRGYDLGSRAAGAAKAQLIQAGLAEPLATTIVSGAGLTGAAAQGFVVANRAKVGNITPGQQSRLFSTVYGEMYDDVVRISALPDVVAAYGAVNFTSLDAAIRDVVVDLRYRGDYTPSARQLIQKTMAANDLPKFSAQIKDDSNWPNVPTDRQSRRRAFWRAMEASNEVLSRARNKPPRTRAGRVVNRTCYKHARTRKSEG